jgi:hypothetical protein
MFKYMRRRQMQRKIAGIKKVSIIDCILSNATETRTPIRKSSLLTFGKQKGMFLAALILFFSFPGIEFSKEEVHQESIVEEVVVNWWQVPVFVVDKSNNPVLDLKETDLEVWVNGRRIEKFSFYKREFIMSQQIPEQAVDTLQFTEIPKKKTNN